jgi:hypothetical protein
MAHQRASAPMRVVNKLLRLVRWQPSTYRQAGIFMVVGTAGCFGLIYGLAAITELGTPALRVVLALSVESALIGGLGLMYKVWKRHRGSSQERVSVPGPMLPYAGLTAPSDASESGDRRTSAD